VPVYVCVVYVRACVRVYVYMCVCVGLLCVCVFVCWTFCSSFRRILPKSTIPIYCTSRIRSVPLVVWYTTVASSVQRSVDTHINKQTVLKTESVSQSVSQSAQSVLNYYTQYSIVESVVMYGRRTLLRHRTIE
jgi:hypothetical protein